MKTSHSSQSPASPPTSTGEKIQDFKAAAAEKARNLKDAAASTVDRAKDEAQEFATTKKTEAADRIGGYGSAIHESAKALEEKDPNLAWFAHRAAERIDRVADYVRNRDFRELRGDVEDLARRNPAVFYGGLFVAGLLIGNVGKASRRNLTSDEAGDGTGMADDNAPADWTAAETPLMQPETSAPAAGT